MSFGYFGLAQATKRFDPARGVKFTTFCRPRVRGAILDGAESMHCWWAPGCQPRTPVALTERRSRRPAPDRPAIDDDFWTQLTRPLTRRERLLVLLYYRQGLRMAQVARVAGCSTPTLFNTLRDSVLPKLRKELSHE